MTAPVTTHVGVTGHRVNEPVTRGTGLHVAQEINGRLAEPWEIEARECAYAAQRTADAQLVRIPPRTSRG